MSELLFEIGTEEIPAGYIQPALDALAADAAKKLRSLELVFESIRAFGTPRRLTLAIDGLQSRQARGSSVPQAASQAAAMPRRKRVGPVCRG